MSPESFFPLKRADRSWPVWEALRLPQSRSHGHMVSVMAFSLTWFLKTHFHTRVATLVYELSRSLCLHNLSSHTGLDC